MNQLLRVQNAKVTDRPTLKHLAEHAVRAQQFLAIFMKMNSTRLNGQP